MCEACLNPQDLEWWPVELSDVETDAVADFYDVLEAEPPALDHAAAARADALLVGAMKRHLPEIIDGSALSHYCHLINGWGDATHRGRTLLEGLATFCRADEQGRAYLVQFDRDGDFHPAQTLAYAAMAGVDLDARIEGVDCSLRELYARSRTIQTDEGIEMGHLLFGLAHLGVDASTTFTVAGRELDVRGIMALAIEGHHHGGFRVCRKVHLTEGICAAAAMLPALHRHRPQAQAFLDGQLDLMLLLALVLERVADPEGVAGDTKAGGLVTALRGTLAVADRFEDHVFLAGHYLELAALAAELGYEVSPVHRNAAVRIANVINRALPAWLPRSPFPEQFLFYGHYRRALTLLPGLLYPFAEAAPARYRRRAEFTVCFDDIAAAAAPGEAPAVPAAFTSAHAETVRPQFAAVIDAVAASLPADLAPVGFRPHFRHIQPPSWPHGLHYELLDYGQAAPAFTLEIHLESEAVRPLHETLAALQGPVASLFPEGARVDWEPDWGRGRGRLRVALSHDTDPALVGYAMRHLIAHTRPVIERALTQLRATARDPGLHPPAVFAAR